MSSGSVKPRRQWRIQDGPKGTLRKLRSQLAEDGCVDSQVVIAKHLLAESQDGRGGGSGGDDGDWKSSTAKAVNWLTKASERGNKEAADLLDRCLNSGIGITEQNQCEVKMCVNMSDEERTLRSAAKDLFVALTPFGQEFVTTHQLRARISVQTADSFPKAVEEDIVYGSGDHIDSAFLKWYRDSSVFAVHLCEEKLVEVASQIARGELPNVRLDDKTTDDETDAKHFKQNNRLISRVLDCGLHSFTSVATRIAAAVAKNGDTFLSRLVPLNELRTLTVVLLCGLLPVSGTLFLLPLLAFYVSILVMIISCVQMMNNSRNWRPFAAWMAVFRTADVDLDCGHLETKFHRRRLKPYATFFSAALVFVCVQPFCPSDLVLTSDLSVIAAIFFVASIWILNVSHGFYFWIFLASSILTVATRLFGHQVSICVSNFTGIDVSTMRLELGDTMAVEIGIASIPATLTLILFVLMAFDDRCRGIYYHFLPNLVCLTWMQLAANFFPQSTWSGLARASLVHIVVAALPVAIAVAAAIAATVIYVLLLKCSPYLVWSSKYFAPTLAAIFVIVTVNLIAKYSMKFKVRPRWKRFLLFVQILCGFLAIFQFVPTIRDTFSTMDVVERRYADGAGGDKRATALDWKAFSELCSHEQVSAIGGERTTMPEVQLDCLRLAKANLPVVNWRGHVKSTRIVDVDNRLEEFVSVLPSSIGAQFRCIYGRRYADDCAQHQRERYENHHLSRTCALLAESNSCHLDDYNRYKFEVEVNMGSDGLYWNTAEISLTVEDESFERFVFKLLPGDQVNFDGILVTPVEAVGRRPVVRITAIRCVDCVHLHRGDAVKTSAAPRSRIDPRDRGWKTFRDIFDFIFNPRSSSSSS